MYLTHDRRTPTSVASEDSHDACDGWPLDDIEYGFRQMVRAFHQEWRVDGIRYNHEGLHWEYLLGAPNGRQWTHIGNIRTRPEDVDLSITNM